MELTGLLQDLLVFVSVTVGQSSTQVWIRAKIQRTLSFLVSERQIRSVGCQEHRDRRTALFVTTMAPETHQQLKNNKNKALYKI